MKVFVSCLVMVLALTAAGNTGLAQIINAAEIDKEVALMRGDLRANKKKLIALNIPLTETEAAKFWPVYDQYVAEMTKHYDDFYRVIKDYANQQTTMTDGEATSLIKRWADIQVQQAQTRQKYIPRVEKVLPGKKAALFFQIDRRLYALMDMQVTTQIPLVTQ